MPSENKRGKPDAVCTACGAYGRNVVMNEDHRCSPRKRGAWRSMLHPDDWKECDRCGGTGRRAGQRCDGCAGEGWHIARRARP